MGQTQTSSAETVLDIEDSAKCSPCVEKENCFNPRLLNSFKGFKRHLILCDGRSDWVKKIERDESSLACIFRKIASEVVNSPPKDGFPLITACSEKNTGPGSIDVLIYPENIRYIGVTIDNARQLWDDQVMKGIVCESIPHIPINYEKLVLICTHETRDKRCGRIGPKLRDRLNAILSQNSIPDQKVAIRSSSHIGGHKHAAVLIVYPSGDWFGQLSERNAEDLLEVVLNKKNLYENWRGRLGLAPGQIPPPSITPLTVSPPGD